ncbi:MAG: four helix bundle protein [Bacteroidales bacterium]|jgi:four helix bundle protein|nr:four helix bundle protein [Bacteroidales bacterium]
MESQSFNDLVMWRKERSFVLQGNKCIKKFPDFELCELTSRFLKAVVSIPANIVERHKKKGKINKLRFFNIAQSSIEECNYIILSKYLDYINVNIEIQLNSLI